MAAWSLFECLHEPKCFPNKATPALLTMGYWQVTIGSTVPMVPAPPRTSAAWLQSAPLCMPSPTPRTGFGSGKAKGVTAVCLPQSSPAPRAAAMIKSALLELAAARQATPWSPTSALPRCRAPLRSTTRAIKTQSACPTRAPSIAALASRAFAAMALTASRLPHASRPVPRVQQSAGTQPAG